ncbi:unnamed protein product [Lactuca saligna]|uniref:Pentacotripeptide-repeat region of PRORP domain-containing protein n=1 Tax=Lactuca saligna TaxID=75948 RepID=A0AA35V731_LACSI|nr:unnamed protein product [Lactuca saligna]
MWPPFTRLGYCCNLVKSSRINIRWKSVRLLAYTTCSDLSGSSSDTNVLCHPYEKLGKFKVTATLDQSKRERNSALLFARELKVFGFKHDVESYMAIIRLLCHSGMGVRLNHLFMYVIDQNINRERVAFEISDLLEALIEEKLIKAVDVLVKVYASVGRFEEAMHTLSEMRSRAGLMVSTLTCNFVLKELIEWEKEHMVESVYRELKRKGLIPNVYTYEILIKGRFSMGRLEKAWNIFAQMREAGVKPNAFIIGTYIRELCWKWKTDLAFQTVKAFRDLNEPVDVFAYTCVIRGFVREGKIQDAEDVLLNDMKIREVVPDEDCYGALILEYLKKGETAKAFDLCDEMKSRVGIEADYVLMRCMMQYLCGVGSLDEALSFFKEFMQKSSKVFIDGVTFDSAIDAACKLGRMEDAMELVEEWTKGRKMKLWEMHYRTLIDGYCLRGEPWNALYMFQEMMRNGYRPDSTSYHVLARGFQGCGVSLPLCMLFKHTC